MAVSSIKIDVGEIVETVDEICRLVGPVDSLPDHLRRNLLAAAQGEGDLIELEITPEGMVGRPSGDLLAILADLRARAR